MVAIISNAADSLVRFRGPLIRQLVDEGCRVITFAPDLTENRLADLYGLGAEPIKITLERTGTSLLKDIRSVAELWMLLRRHRPDVALTYFLKPNIYGGLAAIIAKVPRRVAMIEGLGFLFIKGPKRSWRQAMLRRAVLGLMRISLRHAKRVIFLNPDDLQDLSKAKVIRPGSARLIGGIGVDLDEFDVRPLPSGPPVFLMVGRLLVEKGVREYFAAAKKVKASYPDARFVLVGGRDENPGCLTQEEIEQLLGEGAVEWPGEVTDVQSWIARASVFVLPSYREGLPRSTQEAMAMGRAVITTNVPGCRETVVEGLNGLIVPAMNPTALADAMVRMIEDPELVARMGRASRTLAEDRYDVRRVNKIMVQELLH